MSEIVTQAVAAKHIDLSSRLYADLLARGVLPRMATLDQVRIAYIRYLRQRHGPPTAEALDLTAEKARLAKEQADSMTLKNAILRGEMLNAAEVERSWSEQLRNIRARMMAVPSRIRQRLGHLTPADALIIDREVRDALTEAADALAE